MVVPRVKFVPRHMVQQRDPRPDWWQGGTAPLFHTDTAPRSAKNSHVQVPYVVFARNCLKLGVWHRIQ